jgi:flagellin-like hook-associated protein FlgL
MGSRLTSLERVGENLQNSNSFLQVQGGALRVAGSILARMSELKTMSTDVTKNAGDLENYNKEFLELRNQLGQMAVDKFNGISLFTDVSVQDHALQSQAKENGSQAHVISLARDFAHSSGLFMKDPAGSTGSGSGSGGGGGSGGVSKVLPGLGTDNDLFAYYPFENGDIENRAGLGGDSAYSGTAGHGANSLGDADSAIYFDGSDGAQAVLDYQDDPVTLPLPWENFTFSFWAKPEHLQPKLLNQIGKMPNNPTVWGNNGWSAAGVTTHNNAIDIPYLVRPEHGGASKAAAGIILGTQQIVIQEHGGNHWANQLAYDFPTPITAWTHFSIVYDNNRATLYVDGAAVKTGEPQTTVGAGGLRQVRPGYVIGNTYGGKGPYQGGVDEFRIYSKNLSAAEVSEIKNAGVPTTLNTSTSGGGGSFSLDSYSMDDFTGMIEDVADALAQNGAEQQRLNMEIEGLRTNQVNLEAAHGRIMDADIALESTRFARRNVLVQSTAAMVAQANQLTNLSLNLLPT